MRRWGIGLLALAVLTVIASIAPPASAAGYAPASLAFKFADARINESSGVALSTVTPGVVFTHNDSGDAPRFFAVGPTGETLATYTVAGAGAVDWEDMARGPASNGDGSSLYFADIGNNLRDRAVLDVYEVAEPAVVAGQDATLGVLNVRHLSYEDIRHDAEALIVDPRTGDLVVVAKELHGLTNVYVADGSTLVRAATVVIPRHMSLGVSSLLGPASGTQVTGAAMSDDGTRIVMRTYLEAFEWVIGANAQATFAAPPLRIPLPPTVQGEAIAYSPEGNLYVTSEGVNAPVHRLVAA